MAPACAQMGAPVEVTSQAVTDVNARIAVRLFDPTRDQVWLRRFVIAQQNVHRSLESSWPSGDAIVEDYVKYLHGQADSRNGCILMADYDEEPVGFVCVVASMRGESPDDPAEFSWILDLFVSPEHRRRGVAARLIAEAEHFARSQGARTMRLGVLDRNDAAKLLYERQGFRDYVRVLTKTLDQ